MKKVIYAGVFIPASEVNKLESASSEKLAKDIKNPHITLEFGSQATIPDDLMGKEVVIRVVGEGSTGDNQGFEVEVPEELKDLYKGASVPHITFSISEQGKAVNTKDVPFKEIEPFEIVGRVGYYTDKGVVFNG